jgi:SSS family solute:Na+ symporter
VFTGFYNIPVIAIVMVGLFTKQVPALGPKLVIGFHVTAYGLLKFIFVDVVTIHFLHLYAILFVIEVAIMLFVGMRYPRGENWTYSSNHKVDMQSWVFAVPCAVSLLSSVIALYLLFSPVGLVGGIGTIFWAAIGTLIVFNIAAWARAYRLSPITD